MSLEGRLVLLVQAIGADIKALFQSSLPTAAVSTTLVVSPAKYGFAEVVVADAAALATHTVMCQLVANDDWDADGLSEFEVKGVAIDGSITFTLLCDGPIVGDYKVTYLKV